MFCSLNILREVSTTMLYGGILEDLTPIDSSDPGLASVAQFAFKHIEKFHPDTIPKDSEGLFYTPTVSSSKKAKLQSTTDNKTPLFYQEVTPSFSGDKFQKKKAVLGLTFTFSLTWATVPKSFIHNFVVTLDRERNSYLYSHTFHRLQSSCSRSVPDCDDAAQCTTEPINDNSKNIDEENTVTGTTCVEDATPSKYSLPNSPLTLVTYNIWNFNKKGPEEMYYARINHLGKLVSESGADIIAFQEVRFDFSKQVLSGPSQVDHLREHLPQYQFVFQPAMSFPKDFVGRVEEGLAIFSKYPIQSYDYILLSRDTEDEADSHQRICLHAEIQVPWMENIHVFASHLSLSESARNRSVVEIWNFMKKFKGPSLLMGDLNAEPHERAMKFLRGEEKINGTQTEGLHDGWLRFHTEPRPDAPGKYAKDEPRDEGLTFDASDTSLRKRIDYIFIKEGNSFNIQSVNLLDDKQRQWSAASDHLGVRAILETKTAHLKGTPDSIL